MASCADGDAVGEQRPAAVLPVRVMATEERSRLGSPPGNGALSLSLCPRPLSQSHHHLGRPHACNATPGHEWGFYEVASSHWNVWDLLINVIIAYWFYYKNLEGFWVRTSRLVSSE